MKLPRKGEYVSLKKVKELCIYFDLIPLWDKIAENPPPKPFKSDGCSCWPDVWRDKDGKKVSIYRECLKHDLHYWAGYRGEDIARFLADVELMVGVVLKTKRIQLGVTMFLGVWTGGSEHLPTPFKWGFGRY